MRRITDKFAAGERYVGNVDGETYQVKAVLPAGTPIFSATGDYILYTTRSTIVVFVQESTGIECKCNLSLAHRLLLNRI